jgi:hypothetical protein
MKHRNLMDFKYFFKGVFVLVKTSNSTGIKSKEPALISPKLKNKDG